MVRLPSRNLIYFFININECKIQSFSLNFIKIKILHNNFDLLCLFLYCYHTLLLVSRSMWVLDVLHLLHQLRAPVQVNRKFAKKCKSQPIENRIYWSKHVTQHGKVCHGPIALVHRSAHVIKLNIYINGVKLNIFFLMTFPLMKRILFLIFLVMVHRKINLKQQPSPVSGFTAKVTSQKFLLEPQSFFCLSTILICVNAVS